ncbi:MAG: hypothetical protein K9G31_05145 [Crocinitomicaceae bacterium]|jgi:hypothetical protein|nr:hypothetical protein [Crocinitomicaceae bacterium]
MLVRYIILGFVVAVLSSATGIAYSFNYYKLFDFSAVLPFTKIAWLFTSGSLLVAGLSFVFNKFMKAIGGLIFNVLLAFGTIGSVIIPTVYPPTFPAEIEMPEFYPAFVIPLHFMVPMIWFALSSYFLKNKP